ncbi:hypothetical protein AMS68_004186 [Peltaster fructicola]|uniref:Derlin n=1 Tax=Peltaster fructicola TaxID=286661 RepID=A0A6H0XVM5_9PEZI|nr:hypothetical protein AMS68_004186 [Peltaster fructicola]
MSVVDAFWAAPPVSRTLTLAAVVLSVPTHMGLISPYYVVWITRNVFTFKTVPEVWRFVTSFLLTGSQLSLILDPYFLYTYGSQLEMGSAQFSAPGDFFVYVVFLAVTILLSCGLYLGGGTFLSPLSLALAYTWSVENKDRQVTYFIVTFSAKYLPYAMLLLTFVMASPGAALLQGTGLLAAHLYLFLTKIWPEHGGGKNPIFTPQFVRAWFAGPGGAPSRRTYGTAFSARTETTPQNQTGSGGGWAVASTVAPPTVGTREVRVAGLVVLDI